MKKAFVFLLLIIQFSCISKVQENIVIDEQNVNSAQKLNTISLLFVGDLMQHQAQIDAARTTYGYDYSSYFHYVKDEISNADWAIGNLEVTMGGKPYRGYPSFSAPDEYLYAICNAGFNVLLTANNHCLDKHKKGFERTIHLLDSLNIQRVGTYINKEEREKRYPLLLEKKGFRIAILNYTSNTNGLTATPPNIVNYIDTTIITKDIEVSKAKNPDAIIACMHWGIEYNFLPNKEQKILADWLFKKGVTHIVGSHPHVVQPIEVRKDSITDSKHLLAYSLGNFISNMPERGADGGLMLKIELVKDTTTTRLANCGYSLVWTARPIQSEKRNYQLLPANLPTDSIPLKARNSLKIFINDVDSLFNKHNKGIKEYFFYKKATDFFGD